jgi:hypothetical protein
MDGGRISIAALSLGIAKVLTKQQYVTWKNDTSLINYFHFGISFKLAGYGC